MSKTPPTEFEAYVKEYRAREAARKDVEYDIISSFLLSREWEVMTELNTMTHNWVLWSNEMGEDRKRYLERDLDTIRRLKSTLDKERWIEDCRLSWLDNNEYQPSEDLVSK